MKKSIFSRYLNYLKDNPKGYWFKRKLYGWGWVPARLEGWLVLILFCLAIAAITIWADMGSHSISDTIIRVFIPAIITIIILIVICYLTGEKPKWSWGK